HDGAGNAGYRDAACLCHPGAAHRLSHRRHHGHRRGPAAQSREVGDGGVGDTVTVEGRNVAIEYRSADGHPERLPALAANLVRRQVGVIVAFGGGRPVLAAKAATPSIPIVLAIGGDALASGFVATLGRPGENVTGVTFLNVQMGPKRLQLLCEVVREGPNLAYLTSSKDGRPVDLEVDVARLKAAA